MKVVANVGPVELVTRSKLSFGDIPGEGLESHGSTIDKQ